MKGRFILRQGAQNRERTMIEIPDHTRRLKAYKSGKPISELAREKDLSRIVKLASNENPIGPSPKAIEALERTSCELNRYTDPASTDLVEKMSHLIGKKADQIIFGHGTDSLLAYIITAFTHEHEEVLTMSATFIGIYVSVNKLGRKLRTVPHKDYGYDLEALAGAVTGDTRIIYLANPNNPTGTMFDTEAFELFMARVPNNVLVILDEAYSAYADEFEGHPDGLQYDYENLLVTRTLSKVFGLAGLRIGYCTGPAYLIHELYKVKLPFEPNRLAQVAALAALDDKEFLAQTIETNRLSLGMFRDCFERLEIKYVPTAANFYLMLFASEEIATAFYEGCLDHGLIVRPVKPFGLPNGIRINSGTEEETRFAIDVIEKVHDQVVKPSMTAAG
jgi:histidinol-phosphate aminotransferase